VPTALVNAFASKKIAVNNLATFVQNGYVAGQDEAEGLNKLLAAKPYKTKPVLTGQFNSTDTDFSAEVALVQSKKPTVIFLSGSLPAVGLLVSQLRSAGVTAIICGDVSTALPSFETQLGASGAQGIIGTTFWYYGNPAQTSASATFSSTYLATYGSDPSEYSAIGYDSTLALAHAIRQAESTNPAKIQAALANLKPFQGALGPAISFSSSGALIPRTLTGAAYAVQWSNGALVPYGKSVVAKPKPKGKSK
jgi:branched-chain amino acid transport system substrate-binding protein